jgi:hypothetical protein
MHVHEKSALLLINIPNIISRIENGADDEALGFFGYAIKLFIDEKQSKNLRTMLLIFLSNLVEHSDF